MRPIRDAASKLGRAARLVTQGDASWFRAPALKLADADREHGVPHASHGNFSLSRGEDPDVVKERRRAYLEDAGLGDARVGAPKLHHSAELGRVGGGGGGGAGGAAQTKGGGWGGGGGAVVWPPGVRFADCTPVFFVDPIS